jgi:hypothetical protein
MRDAIAPLDTAETRARYASGDFPRAELVKDLDRRYRWDLFHAARLAGWACDTVYPYATDTHLDTALRSIVAPLVTP